MSGLRERAVVTYAQFASGLFTMLGALGLTKTHFDAFASSEGVSLLGMTVNPLMNLIHLAVGLAGIAMALTVDGALRYTRLVAAVGVPFAVLELALSDSASDIFGRDGDLALVQLAVALLGIAVWMWARRGPVPAPGRG